MPKQVSKSGLAGRLGDKGRQAVEQHKHDEVNYGRGGDLPAGIEGGIAQVVDCRFAQYKEGQNAGEYFYIAAAVVKLPVEHNGIRIEGGRTQIGPEPMCDTPTRGRKTVADHVAWVLNEFRKLGIETDGMGLDDLEPTAALIKEAKPHIKFRTWSGQKQTSGPYAGQEPRVNHDWKGLAQFDGEPTEGVVEVQGAGSGGGTPTTATASSEGAEESEFDVLGNLADAGDEDAQRKLSAQAGLFSIDEETANNTANWMALAQLLNEASANDEKSGAGTESTTDVDYGALGTQADEGDQDAINTLDTAGREAGLDPDDYATWADLAITLSGGAADEPEPAKEIVAKKGQVLYYKPKGAKTRIECEVILVFKNKTANLKNMDDRKTVYKEVPWGELSETK